MGRWRNIFNIILLSLVFVITLPIAFSFLSVIIFTPQLIFGSGPSWTVLGSLAKIIISALIPILLAVSLFFHFRAFKKSDLESKPFKVEYYINLVSTLIVLPILLIIFVVDSIGLMEGIGMAFVFPLAILVLAILVSFIYFFYGYAKYKRIE